MTPDRTCFTHRARINGIEKKKKKKTCPGLHGRAQLDGVGKQRVLSWTSMGTFPGKLLHQFDSDPRESCYIRASTRGTREQTGKISACEEIVSRTVPNLYFLDLIAEHRSW